MEFKRYLEVEALHKEEVDGLLVGEIWVFPKLDGANASVWLDDKGVLQAGSRNRPLSFENDNAGFMKAVYEQPMHDNLVSALAKLGQGARLFGEWLVPHTLRTYKEDAWRRFYVFDAENEQGYMHFNDYAQICRDAGLDVIAPLEVLTNPSSEHLESVLQHNTYMVKPGAGAGEGIVLKNYGFKNKWGRPAYGKIVKDAFKDSITSGRLLEDPNGPRSLELEIASDFVTEGRLNKLVEKIGPQEPGKFIPAILAATYHEIVEEELWDILKKHRDPALDFKVLRRAITAKVKDVKKQWF